MKSRIRGGDAARAAVAMADRRPVPLLANDMVGPFKPCAAGEAELPKAKGRPPTLTPPKPSLKFEATLKFTIKSSK
jgi:hypothetical protein